MCQRQHHSGNQKICTAEWQALLHQNSWDTAKQGENYVLNSSLRKDFKT